MLSKVICLPLSECMKCCAHDVHFGWGETEMLCYMMLRQDSTLFAFLFDTHNYFK